MVYLRWEKPKRARSKEEHSEISFEDGPKGGYVPNMSDDDANAWKAKVTGTKLGYPQVEIRKQAGPALMLLIVNLGDGYNYKSNRSGPDEGPDTYSKSRWEASDFWGLFNNQYATWGKAIHLSLNGGGQLTTEEAIQLPIVIEEAKAVLNQLVKVPGDRKLYAAWLDPNTDTGPLKAAIEEMGGKIALDRPQYNLLYFTAPEVLIEPIFKLGMRAIYMADRVQRVAQHIEDRYYDMTRADALAKLEKGMAQAGPEGPGHPLISRGG